MPTIEEFELAYARLTYSPSRIAPGLTYDQLLAAWEAAGRPADIETFLVRGKTEKPRSDSGSIV